MAIQSEKDSLGPFVISLPPPLSPRSLPLSLCPAPLSPSQIGGCSRRTGSGMQLWTAARGEDAAAAGGALSCSVSTAMGAAAQRGRTRRRRAAPCRAPCQRRRVHPRWLRLCLHHDVRVNGSSLSNSIPSNGSTPS